MTCRAWQAHGKLKNLHEEMEKKQVHVCQTSFYICEIPKGVRITAGNIFRAPQIKKG